MMVALSLALSLLCASGALWRLKRAATPTSLDYGVLRREHIDRLRAQTLARTLPPGLDRELLEAASRSDTTGPAELNLALLELEAHAAKGERLPRAAASIASSGSFLLAAWSMRQAFSAEAGLSEELWQRLVETSLLTAVNIVALGTASAIVCALCHVMSHKEHRRCLGEVDAWLEALDDAPAPEGSPHRAR